MTIINMREFLDIEAGKKKAKPLDSESEYEDGTQSAAEWDDSSKEVFFSFADPKNNRILNMKVMENDHKQYEF